MGCDIHLYREKKVNGVWETADKWSVDEGYGKHIRYEDCYYKGRNYELFGILSKGVRRDIDFGIPGRGLPEDMSPEVRAEFADAGYHSESWLTLTELKALRALVEIKKIKVTGMMHKKQWDRLEESISSGQPDWSLLSSYCSRTNQKDHVRFEVNVPAVVLVGSSLDTLIKNLEVVGGQKQRLVFGFDS